MREHGDRPNGQQYGEQHRLQSPAPVRMLSESQSGAALNP
jgi:hypothetical protein